ncbi:hypothetical protein Acr_14g0001680 [Actinidia rufa]|uniref:Reverse transcriptase domain-containing protein n=1 Tax=Actinidia rufa TaxID=165716 RepID=A0A7J0FP88_9ERIC|nr:hypothetical protein Acr_14g0001680 [Actinidia rufa]
MGRMSKKPEFRHHAKCAEMAISHLAFADDLILFTRGDAVSVSLSMECLKNFGACSGLCISATKSHVYMAGIDQEEMEKMKTISGLSMGEFPFRYLGIPVPFRYLGIPVVGMLAAALPPLAKGSDVRLKGLSDGVSSDGLMHSSSGPRALFCCAWDAVSGAGPCLPGFAIEMSLAQAANAGSQFAVVVWLWLELVSAANVVRDTMLMKSVPRSFCDAESAKGFYLYVPQRVVPAAASG